MRNYKYMAGVSIVALLMTSGANLAFAQDNTSQAEPEDVIVVTGIRQSLKKSLDVKRKSGQIVDAITSEDIGKFPDQNIAESLQRISGVQIQRGVDDAAGSSSGDGEGSSVSIRGMRPDLNKVTVNGNSMASTTGGRGFNFSNLAPELVERLEVFKSPSADMDEGGIGGSVNLVTRTPLKIGKSIAVGSAKITRHDLADKTNYRASGLVSNVFGKDERLGVLLGVNYTDESLRRDSVESFGWSKVKGFDGLVARDIRQNLKLEERTKLSLNGTLEFQATDRLNLRFDALYTDQESNETASNYQIRVGQNGIINDVITNANGTAVFVSTSPKNKNQKFHRIVAFDRTDTRKTGNYVANANWDGDNWDIGVRGGYTEGSFERTPSLFAVFAASGDLTYDLRGGSLFPVITSSATDVNNPDASKFDLINISQAHNTNKETETFGQIDFDREVGRNIFTTVEFGVKYRDRLQVFTKQVDAATGGERAGFTLADFVQPFPVDDFGSQLDLGPLSNTWAFPDHQAILGTFSTDPGGIIGDPVLRLGKDELANFDVGEETLAGYAKANFENGRIRGDFGVRVIKTNQTNNGFAGTTVGKVTTFTPISSSRNYTNVLPNINVVFTAKDDLLFRFSAAKVMTRGRFKDLSNGGSVNAGGQTATLGNPDLDPYEATALDASAEWYFDDGALLSAGVFYKDIGTFITQTQQLEILPGQGPNEFLVKRPTNGEADVKGFELSYQQNFTFLPAPFDGIGVVANYTYVDSTSQFVDAVTGGFQPLPGTSKHSGNIVGFYEKDKFSVRLAYNIRSKFVIFPLSLGDQAVIRKAYSQLDATMSYNLNDHVSFVVEATNLANSTPYDFAGVEERFVAFRDTGRRFGFTTRVKF